MLFHEIYSLYYHTVAKILQEAVSGTLTEQKMRQIAETEAFQDSFLEILPALQNGRWKLLYPDGTAALRHIPTMSLTTLQLRWLKAITLDKRFQLFAPEIAFLDEISPLFRPENIVYYDQYQDGDDYDSPTYQEHFRILLQAIREKKRVQIQYRSAKGKLRKFFCDPYELEYSEKDDKFRMKCNSCRYANTVKLSGIIHCEITGDASSTQCRNGDSTKRVFVAELVDERNALERFLLQFSYFEKETQQLTENRYRIQVYYAIDDETEILIRILSFGPFVRVIAPEQLVSQIQNRLRQQRTYFLDGTVQS